MPSKKALLAAATAAAALSTPPTQTSQSMAQPINSQPAVLPVSPIGNTTATETKRRGRKNDQGNTVTVSPSSAPKPRSPSPTASPAASNSTAVFTPGEMPSAKKLEKAQKSLGYTILQVFVCAGVVMTAFYAIQRTLRPSPDDMQNTVLEAFKTELNKRSSKKSENEVMVAAAGNKILNLTYEELYELAFQTQRNELSARLSEKLA